jgi:hypothetical protein
MALYIITFTDVRASETEDTALTIPLSSIWGDPIPKDSVLLESISFELSDTNPAQKYLITDACGELIFSFTSVSAPINVSFKTPNGDSHRAGFSGLSSKYLTKIDSNSEYEFEWSRGFIDFDSSGVGIAYVQTELVDFSSGVLEIYQVKDK